MKQDVEKLKEEIREYLGCSSELSNGYYAIGATIEYLHERGLLAMDAPDKRVDDMAILIRRLVNRLRKDPSAAKICEQSVDYLRRKSLPGSVLRDECTQDPHTIASSPVQAQETGVVAKHDEAG